jgi:BirA family biotin operon repressor/biotin-[acetyl-CoA-carboxylase] ligase
MTSQNTALTEALRRLRTHGYVFADTWPCNVTSAHELGLIEEAGTVRLPVDVRLHDLAGIRQGLPQQLSVQLYDYVDSTNSAMLRSNQHEVVANHLMITEFQSAGRGRRGKAWLGDYGRNIAMTLGIEFRSNLNALGGLSSVVGLALVQALELQGIDAQLKWPNDVWINEQKLAGILVELVPTNTGTLAVIGIGVNVDLSSAQADKIDQAVTCIRHLGSAVSRDDLVLAICRNILENLEVFAHSGFASFVAAFNAVHCLQNKYALLLLAGEAQEGIVRGIDVSGGLVFEERGQARIVSSGEVSLRPA